MKPVTSALHNWMSALMVNKYFKTADFRHLPDGVGSTHYNQYLIWRTQVPEHRSHCMNYKDVLKISLSNSDSNHIYVNVIIEQPDVIFTTGSDNEKCYTNLKLKDVIDFMKMYTENFETQYGRGKDSCYGLYYAEPFNDGLMKTIKEFIARNSKAYNEYKNMVKTCFEFLDKREAMNIRLKAKDSDF